MESLKTKTTTNEGWAVLVYGGDRRLICSLTPSHLWMFLSGIVVGTLCSLALFSLQPSRQSSSAPTEPAPPSEVDPGIQAPLQVD